MVLKISRTQSYTCSLNLMLQKMNFKYICGDIYIIYTWWGIYIYIVCVCGIPMIGGVQVNFTLLLSLTVISKLFLNEKKFILKTYLNYLIMENDTSIFSIVFKNMIVAELTRIVLTACFPFLSLCIKSTGLWTLKMSPFFLLSKAERLFLDGVPVSAARTASWELAVNWAVLRYTLEMFRNYGKGLV